MAAPAAIMWVPSQFCSTLPTDLIIVVTEEYIEKNITHIFNITITYYHGDI